MTKSLTKNYKNVSVLKLNNDGCGNNDDCINRYVQPYLSYFIATKPIRGETNRISSSYTCREEYIEAFGFRVLGQLNYKSKYDDYIPIPLFEKRKHLRMCTKKTYIGIEMSSMTSNKSTFIEEMSCSLNIINVLEERHGWPLSTIYHIKDRNMVVFSGTNKWIKTPFALSLYTILIRLGETNLVTDIRNKYANKYEMYDNVVKTLKEIDAKYYLKYGCFKPIIMKPIITENRTLKRAVETVRAWDLLIKEYDTIFKGRSFLSNYGYRAVTEYCRREKLLYSNPTIHARSCDGLTRLVKREVTDLEIDKRFTKLMEAS